MVYAFIIGHFVFSEVSWIYVSKLVFAYCIIIVYFK